MNPTFTLVLLCKGDESATVLFSTKFAKELLPSLPLIMLDWWGLSTRPHNNNGADGRELHPHG